MISSRRRRPVEEEEDEVEEEVAEVVVELEEVVLDHVLVALEISEMFRLEPSQDKVIMLRLENVTTIQWTLCADYWICGGFEYLPVIWRS